MSDPRAKAERSKAKDARQIPLQEKKTKRSPSKKDKPIIVQFRYLDPSLSIFGWFKDWVQLGKYKDIETANQVIKNDKRKHQNGYEYRIISKPTTM